MERFLRWKIWLTLGILGAFFAAGCAALKDSRPILPIKEYEKLIAGRLDADYIGTDNCLKACHFHDKIRRDFDLSTMGAQLSRESGLPLVNCESCHGPGSLAVDLLTPEKLAADAKAGRQSACDFKTFIDIKNIPAQARSLICLKCHSANATFNLHNWSSATHNIADVSCSDCHKIHGGHNLKVKLRDTAEMCERCHQDIKAAFTLPNHHPVPEKKIFCTDCHDPHGGQEKGLRRETVKATCTQCHAEKEGPFVYEHADISENCTACHTPHGSVNNNLLILREPFLCLQCHPTHPSSISMTSADKKRAYYTRCTDCHSQIHGSDLPSSDGKGTFLQ